MPYLTFIKRFIVAGKCYFYLHQKRLLHHLSSPLYVLETSSADVLDESGVYLITSSGVQPNILQISFRVFIVMLRLCFKESKVPLLKEKRDMSI